MISIQFWGGASEVTGACYLIKTPRTKFLLDCGLFQGAAFCDKRNYEPFPFKASEVNFALLSHAHIDHSGRLPKLVKEGFGGRIYSTAATKDLAGIMLEDSVSLLEEEAQRHKLELLYDTNDLEKTMGYFVPLNYRRKVQPAADVTAEFLEAGHILGSAIVQLWIKTGPNAAIKIVFSGDLGNPKNSLLQAADVIGESDYLIIESAYGDRTHETKQQRRDVLEDIAEDTIRRGGTLLIPAFAVERVQEILFELNDLVEQGRIPKVPVFLDSPLAIKATEIYKNHQESFNQETAKMISRGEEIFRFPGLKFTPTVEESKAINDAPSPKIVIAGSGNLSGGRILHHARRYLSDPKSSLVVVGYQHAGSLGRRLVEGIQEVKIFDEIVPVRARIVKIDGYSAHADQNELVDFVGQMRSNLKQVFVVQGEERASQTLAQRIKDEFAIPAEVPKLGSEFQLV